MKEKSIFGIPIFIIRKNIIYIFFYVIFIFVILYFIPYTIRTINKDKEAIFSLTQEIENNKIKKQEASLYSSFDIDSILKKLEESIPQNEDIFSILGALHLLSKQEGITIENYPSIPSNKNDNILELEISFNGDKEKLEKILADHHFKSGRFMTVKKASYSDKDKKISLTLLFYSGKINEKLNKISNEELSKIINDLKTKPTTSFYNSNITNPTYETNTNPFGIILNDILKNKTVSTESAR